MLETTAYCPEQPHHLSRRGFLELMGKCGLGAAVLSLLTGCGFRDPGVTATESVTSTPKKTEFTATPTSTPAPTELPTDIPIQPTLTPEPSPTPIPEERKYADLFGPETNLDYTAGAVDFSQEHSCTIPADANPHADIVDQQDQTYTFDHPLVADTEGSWEELLPKRTIFNTWQDKEEKVLMIAGRPSTHIFLIQHSNTNKVTKQSRIFSAEAIRQAMEIEKSGKDNPLIGKSWKYTSEGGGGKLYRTTMKFVHMTEIKDTDLWENFFYQQDGKGRMFVDYHLATLPDPNDPQKQVPVIPVEHQGPQHVTIATCNHGKATLATLQVETVEEITNPLVLFFWGLRHGLRAA